MPRSSPRGRRSSWGTECRRPRTSNDFVDRANAVPPSTLTPALRYSPTCRGRFLDGQIGGFANRLGKRELAIRQFVGRSGFCLRIFWVSPIVGAHEPRLRVDGASVRDGVHLLDLLPARSTPAGYSAEDCAKRKCTA